MEAETTARFFREESWLLDLFDHRVAQAWGQGDGDLVVQSRARARGLWAVSENQGPLPDRQRQEVEDLAREADRLAGE